MYIKFLKENFFKAEGGEKSPLCEYVFLLSLGEIKLFEREVFLPGDGEKYTGDRGIFYLQMVFWHFMFAVSIGQLCGKAENRILNRVGIYI